MLLAVPTAEATIVTFDEAGFVQQVEASPAQKLDLDWPAIRRLYERLDEDSIWHSQGHMNARGRQLLAWLKAAGEEGLKPADYHVEHLQRLQNQAATQDSMLRELLLTDAYLRLAVDLRQGNRATRALDPFWTAQAESFDPVVTLIRALAQDRLADMLAQLGPAGAEYDRLRQALARYRAIERAGGWPRLVTGTSLRPGQRVPQIERLRERLALESGRDYEQTEDPELFDARLETELKRFQTRHGLAADGVAGPATLEALNVPVARRIEQLRINLERWRWLPHEMETEHLLVNTAGFDIEYHSHDRVIFSARTVNGSEERPTPSMISRITHLVANPQWTVPRRIAVEDMLPRQQADPGYLTGKRIQVYRRNGAGWEAFDPASIDWSPYDQDNFPFVLQQEAGAGNSLGRIKFHMPNPNAIFLHDTPAVGLFGRSERAFSSGCVRVERADRLARLLIERADPWEARKFNQALETGETLIIPLRQPLSVYLTYFTSWVDTAGEVHFRPDIYQRDDELMLAFARQKHPMTVLRPDQPSPASL
ncbi:MAG: L,D-transpeptidase family protein [Candidatus Thiodiazotropha sp.]